MDDRYNIYDLLPISLNSSLYDWGYMFMKLERE